MKIGLSYSRCVRDIVQDKVSIDDVLIIIARTNFDPKKAEQWESIWKGYTTQGLGSWPEWAEYANDVDFEDRFRSVTIDLLETGRLHQPRQFGYQPRRLSYYWLETVLVEDDLHENPTVRQAWDQYQMLAGLAGRVKSVDDNF